MRLQYATDGQQALQLPHACERLLEFDHAVRQPLLQPDDAGSHLQAGLELLAIDRLGDVVVGAGAKPLHDVLGADARGEQNQVWLIRGIAVANGAADVHAIHARHHPVEHGDAGCVGRAQQPQRLEAIRTDDRVVAPLLQRFFEQSSRDGFIFGNEYVDGRTGARGTGGRRAVGRGHGVSSSPWDRANRASPARSRAPRARPSSRA